MLIGSREICNYKEPYIIAEIGANHNGNVDIAKQLINKAIDAGCDCVKFQSWTADSIFSKIVYEDNYFLGDDYRNRNDYNLKEIVEEFSFSERDLSEIAAVCKKGGVDFACTPFSKKEVDYLVENLKVDFIKVASMDLNNYPFLQYIAQRELPIMLSTGLSTLSEIDSAVQTIENTGNKNIILLHCVANYPPDDNYINLNNIDMLRDNYPDYPVGFSDHSIGIEIPLAAAAKGACVIEKHFTLDKNMPGWDHKVSANFEEMVQIVNGTKRINKALGSHRRVLTKADYEKIPAFRRSVVAARDIQAGELITIDDLNLKRPGTGIEPKYLEMIAGRIAKRFIPYDKVLTQEDF